MTAVWGDEVVRTLRECTDILHESNEASMNARIDFQTGEYAEDDPDWSQEDLDAAIIELLRKEPYDLSEMFEGCGIKCEDELTEAQIRGAAVCALEQETPINLIALGHLVLKRIRASLDDAARSKLRWDE